MAQHVQIKLIDDIDGSDAAETVSFGLDGVVYEIDLSERNAAQLRDDLANWVGNARRVKGRTARGARPASTAREDLNKVREWGRANGFSVSERGRVSREVQEAYAAAH
ncbi:Lsr2 family protein [Yimella sp. cx-51]|uniref:histone-like nucleoid-structuring protein Lsr2 n=1 Tax=Yimella sp. cx-51 TaxID=2770551 RepID=UPI00165E570F|nr:Lsr2 family protein [Yimella sp. cx-51]MBC9956380.1 Lsr2 family protein [Yimella sp. cx-51]MBD2759825.1 Lsr2 family protein [Yimella sp. cx-573]QTH38500.1 Lsr2 family protein [Yimella sp. cx-51]